MVGCPAIVVRTPSSASHLGSTRALRSGVRRSPAERAGRRPTCTPAPAAPHARPGPTVCAEHHSPRRRGDSPCRWLGVRAGFTSDTGVYFGWTITSYSLVFGSLLRLGGRAADL